MNAKPFVVDEYVRWSDGDYADIHLSCDFKYPARLDDRLRVAVYFTRFGTTSVTINFDVLHVQAIQLAAAGREVLACVDRQTMRPKPLPPDLLAFLQPFALDQGDARRHLGLPGLAR